VATEPRLLAVSDLHVSFPENKPLAQSLRPTHAGDWLIVAGDVGEKLADIEETLRLLANRFARVIWVPGNHELWTHPREDSPLRGVARYERLVEICRELGVLTPEDPYPVFGGRTIAPLFTLYDYSFRTLATQREALDEAYRTGIVCTDERFLHPDPYPTREAWCAARIDYSLERLAAIDGPTVLVNHWPLTREPTDVLRYPIFAQWCGTTKTQHWPTKFNADVVVYGHLHIPRVITVDGVRQVEASVGYPREWHKHGLRPELFVDVFDPVRPSLAAVPESRP
jgi:3',5'-cyclic AMP phosphodiesterase CpdA